MLSVSADTSDGCVLITIESPSEYSARLAFLPRFHLAEKSAVLTVEEHDGDSVAVNDWPMSASLGSRYVYLPELAGGVLAYSRGFVIPSGAIRLAIRPWGRSALDQVHEALGRLFLVVDEGDAVRYTEVVPSALPA